MPDICMCKGNKCPLKEKCYRHTARATEYRQAYFVEAPYDHEAGECKHYWEREDKKNPRTTGKKTGATNLD